MSNTNNSFCFLRYVFRQGAVFILGILIHSFLLLFSFFSKDQNFYDNPFYQCPCLNKFAKCTKSTSRSGAKFGKKCLQLSQMENFVDYQF